MSKLSVRISDDEASASASDSKVAILTKNSDSWYELMYRSDRRSWSKAYGF